MKILIGFLLISVLWIVSIPCTLLVIVFQLAKDNADNLYLWINDGIQESKEKKMSFKEKLAERMKQNPPVHGNKVN